MLHHQNSYVSYRTNYLKCSKLASVSPPRATVNSMSKLVNPISLLWHIIFSIFYAVLPLIMKIPIFFLTICQHYLPPNRISCSIHSCYMLEILDCWHSLLVGWVLLNKIPIWRWGYVKRTPNLATVPLKNLFFLIVCSHLKCHIHQLLMQAYTRTEKLCNFMYTEWTKAKGNKTI